MRASYVKSDDPIWQKVYRDIARGLSKRASAARRGLTFAQIKGHFQTLRGTRTKGGGYPSGPTRLCTRIHRLRCDVCGMIYTGPLGTVCPNACAML